MPGTPTSRLNNLEKELSRLEQKFEDLSRDVITLVPLSLSFVKIESSVESLNKEFHQILDGIKEREKESKDERKEIANDRKSVRVALYGLAGIIIASIIGAFATLAAAGLL